MKHVAFTCYFRILFGTEKPNKTSNETTGCVCLTSLKGNCSKQLVCIINTFVIYLISLFTCLKLKLVDANSVEHINPEHDLSPVRWFWHFYAISVGWNGLLLALYLNFTLKHQPYPSWLTGMLDILTGLPSTDSQGRLLC